MTKQQPRGFLSLDRVLTISMTIIGALTMIIWGIVWMNLTNVMMRTATLEGDKRVLEQQLDSIRKAQDDLKTEMKAVVDAVNRMDRDRK